MSKTTHLKIGELAKRTGLAVGTLRCYGDLGILQPVQRGDNGYRYYSQNASKQVEFIKKAQAISFTLEAIKTILDDTRNKFFKCFFTIWFNCSSNDNFYWWIDTIFVSHCCYGVNEIKKSDS